MIKAVFFDLDGTLYDRDAFVTELLSYQFEVFRTKLDGLGKSRFVERIRELDDHGHGNKLEAYKSAGVEWGLSSDLIDRLLEHFWSNDGYFRVDPAVPRLRLADDTRMTLQTLRCRALSSTVCRGSSRCRRGGREKSWTSRRLEIRALLDPDNRECDDGTQAGGNSANVYHRLAR